MRTSRTHASSPRAAPAFKRSHFYELTAAAFGYRSYAALAAESVLYQASTDPAGIWDRIFAAMPRATELGYHADDVRMIATRVCAVLSEHRVAVVRLTDLIRSLRWQHHDDSAREEVDDEDDLDLNQPWQGLELSEGGDPADIAMLLDGLRAAAGRNSAPAHYALALLHEPDLDAEQRHGPRSYWYHQRHAGKALEPNHI